MSDSRACTKEDDTLKLAEYEDGETCFARIGNPNIRRIATVAPATEQAVGFKVPRQRPCLHGKGCDLETRRI